MVAIRSEGSRNLGSDARTRGVVAAIILTLVVGGWWWTWTAPILVTGLSYDSSMRPVDYPAIFSETLRSNKGKSGNLRTAKPALPIYDHKWLTDDKTISELWYDSECESFRKKEQPIPSEELWRMLRERYVSVVGPKESRIADPSSTPWHGFGVPFEAKQAGEKGRGVFATANVSKGQLVWSATRFTAVFKTADLYRTFLRSLPYYESCQAMGYTWPAKTKSEGKKPWIAVDLDPGALMNSGSHGYGEKEYQEDVSNVQCVGETKDHPKGACFALRDIASGEEFLCDYSGFSDSSWFRKLGL